MKTTKVNAPFFRNVSKAKINSNLIEVLLHVVVIQIQKHASIFSSFFQFCTRNSKYLFLVGIDYIFLINLRSSKVGHDFAIQET